MFNLITITLFLILYFFILSLNLQLYCYVILSNAVTLVIYIDVLDFSSYNNAVIVQTMNFNLFILTKLSNSLFSFL